MIKVKQGIGMQALPSSLSLNKSSLLPTNRKFISLNSCSKTVKARTNLVLVACNKDNASLPSKANFSLLFKNDFLFALINNFPLLFKDNTPSPIVDITPLSIPDTHKASLPIIIGETEGTPHSAFILQENGDKLKANNVTVVTVQNNPLKKTSHNLPVLKKTIRKIMSDKDLSDDECEKILIWLTAKDVKEKLQGLFSPNILPRKKPIDKGFKIDIPLTILLRLHSFNPPIKDLLLDFVRHLDSQEVTTLYTKKKLKNINPLDIAIPLCKAENINCYQLHTNNATGNLMDDIQKLTEDGTKNIISIMGVNTMNILRANYPEKATYYNLSNNIEDNKEKIIPKSVAYPIDYKNFLKILNQEEK